MLNKQTGQDISLEPQLSGTTDQHLFLYITRFQTPFIMVRVQLALDKVVHIKLPFFILLPKFLSTLYLTKNKLNLFTLALVS